MDKRAVIVGINYPDSSAPLNGCINDALNVKEMLFRRGYSIRFVIDDGSDNPQPTRQTILSELLNLILSGKRHLYFHYSGHGSYVNDVNGDERDGKDETLVPCDYQQNGMILDDEIKGILECLRGDQTLVMVLDCCHSGTGADLGYNVHKNWTTGELKCYRDTYQRELRGQVICISGCQDTQTSADAYIQGSYQGALTSTLLGCLDEGDYTWERLLKTVRKRMKGQYSQIPNLTCARWQDLKAVVEM